MMERTSGPIIAPPLYYGQISAYYINYIVFTLQLVDKFLKIQFLLRKTASRRRLIFSVTCLFFPRIPSYCSVTRLLFPHIPSYLFRDTPAFPRIP